MRPKFFAEKLKFGNYHVLGYDAVSETWSLTLRNEHRLRVFENRVLRKMVGPTRD
jgi:hypothetical protein